MTLPYNAYQLMGFKLSAATWAERELGFVPDLWQRKALLSRRDICLVCSRQAGKTETVSVIGAHQSLFFPGTTTVVISPGQRQSLEVFRRISDYVKSIIKGKFPEDNRLSMTLPNKSRIISLPASESSIRGYSVDLLIVDEAARVPDEIYASIRPMVAVTKGRSVYLSTPLGMQGVFYSVATGDDDEWDRFFVPASEVPRISQEFLDRELKLLGKFKFEQEYNLSWAMSGSPAFDADALSRAFGARVAPTPSIPVLPAHSPLESDDDETDSGELVISRTPAFPPIKRKSIHVR